MINAISKKEYTGSNFDTLMVNGAVEGQEFATFKQMIKYLKCSGKAVSYTHLTLPTSDLE